MRNTKRWVKVIRLPCSLFMAILPYRFEDAERSLEHQLCGLQIPSIKKSEMVDVSSGKWGNSFRVIHLLDDILHEYLNYFLMVG